MQKIMFNDRFCLTEAVLKGTKTITRRVATWETVKEPNTGFLTDQPEAGTFVLCDRFRIVAKSKYKIGEVVAVAQSYKDLKLSYIQHIDEPGFKTCTKHAPQWGYPRRMKGWSNKMFVRAELMPHQILITNIKVERLQNISDEDCIREGIQSFDTPVGKVFVAGGVYVGQDARLKIAKGMINLAKPFKTPREAFAVLIDKVSSKGTWKRNPFVFVYTFKLIK